MDLIDPVFVHGFHNKTDMPIPDLFPFSGNMLQDVDNMSGYGVIVIGFDMTAESFVDIFQLCAAVHHIFRPGAV